MKLSELSVKISQRKWLVEFKEYAELVVLGSVIGSYLICLYLLCFDHRIAENAIPIITFWTLDVLYLIDSVARFRSKVFAQPVRYLDLKGTLRCPGRGYIPVVLDILSMIPLEVFHVLRFPDVEDFIFNKSGKYSQRLFMFAVLRSNRLLRLYRIVEYYLQQTAKVVLNIYKREVRAITVAFLAFVIILFHSFACVWYLLSCQPVYKDKAPECKVRNTQAGHPFYKNVKSNLPDAWGRYVGALHWSVMTLRNSGIYYVPPVNITEMTIAVAFMLSGFFLISSIICLSIYVMGHLDLCRSIFFHEASGVTNFVRHLKMDNHISMFLHKSFNYMWSTGNAFSDETMRKLLPKSLQTDVSMCIFQPLIEASEMLKSFRREALEALSLKVHYRHYLPHEFIIRPHTVGFSMFFVVEGKVEVINNTDLKPLLTLSKGSLIGEVNIAMATFREHGVKTATVCHILKLTWQDVMSVIHLDPAAREKMQKIIKRRMRWHLDREFIAQLRKQGMLAEFVSQHKLQDKNIPNAENEDSQPNGKVKGALAGALKRARQAVETVESGGAELLKNITTKAPLMIRKNLAKPVWLTTQFLSVFTWLRFHRNERDSIPNSEAFNQMLIDMNPKLRNKASQKYYTLLPIDKTPLYYWHHFAISRETYIYSIWAFFVCCTAAIYTIYYPISLVIVDASFSQPVNIIIDVIYFSDLLLRLFVFRDPYEMAPVASITKHFYNEISNWTIWLDVLPIFPIYNISYILWVRYDRLYLYMRMNSLIKFWKVIMKFRTWENDVSMNTIIVRLTKHVTYITIIIVYVACNFVQERCKSGYQNCKFEDTTTTETQRFNFGKQSVFDVSAYWAVCVTFGIGFTDVSTISTVETTIHSIALLVGLFFWVYCCSDLAVTLSGAIKNKVDHQDNRVWLHRYLDEALTEIKLMTRVDRYMNVQWIVLQGINSDSATRLVGFLSVSHSIYTELIIHIMAESLYQSDLFKLLDADIVKEFCLTARLVVVPPNEQIISRGDFVRRIYVIRRGLAEVCLASNGMFLGNLSKGHSIGFGEFIYGGRASVTIKSITYLELIMIDANSIERAMRTSKSFKEIWNSLKDNKEAKEDFRAYFDVDEPVKFNLKGIDYQNVSKEVFVYHRVRQRVGKQEDIYLKEWIKSRCCRCCRFFVCPLTILPTSTTLKIWEGFRVLTIIFMMFWLPVVEAFPYLKKDYGSFIYITDCVTLIDMLIRLHVAYYDFRSYELITHPLHSAKHYLTSAFLTDVIGGPLVYFLIDNAFTHYAPNTWNASIYAYLLRLNRMILLYHLFGAYLFADSAPTTGQNSWKMIKLIPLFLYHAHIMSCLLAVTTCPATEVPLPVPRCRDKTWISMSKTLADPQIVFQGHNRSAVHLSDYQIYVFGFYYSATTLVACGFSDFLPASYAERCFSAVLFFIYIFTMAYVLATVVGSKCHLDEKLLQFQQELRYLIRFMRREKVDLKIQSAIAYHYDYQWLRTKGIEPHKLFYNLFPTLRKEVALNLFEDVLRQIPGMNRISRSFLRAICVYLSPLYFIGHTVVVREGDFCDTVFFIYRGSVLLSNAEIPWGKMKEGGVIGNTDPYITVAKFVATVHAVSNLEIFSIKKKDFNRVLQAFPIMAVQFKRLAELIALHAKTNCRSKHNQGFIRPLDDLQRQPGKTSLYREDPTKASKVDQLDGSMNDSDDDDEEELSSNFPEQDSVHSMALKMDLSDKALSLHKDSQQYLLPDSWSFLIMEVSVFMAAALSVCIVCYQAAFEDDRVDDYGSITFFVIGYMCDVVYVVKIIVTFRMSYFDENGELVLDYSEIGNKYLSSLSGFSWDFLSTFPLEIFSPTSPSRIPWIRFLTFLRLNRTLRLPFIFIWQRVCCKPIPYGIVGVVKILPMKNPGFIPNEQLYAQLTSLTRMTFTPNGINLVENKQYKEIPYILTMYFILSTFTTTAYGDVVPVTSFEMIFISLIAISSKVWLGLALSDILSGLQNTTDVTFHLAAHGVQDLYRNYGVSDEIRDKVEKYFSYAWEQNKGIILPQFILRAPMGLRMDITDYVYGDQLRQSYMFRDLCVGFYRCASSKIRHVYVLSGDYVVREKEIDNSIYFIHRGFIMYHRTIMDTDGNTKEQEGILSRFRYFGEAHALLGPLPHEYSYRAESNLDILHLTYTDFEELFEMFPEHRERVYRRLHLKTLAAKLEEES